MYQCFDDDIEILRMRGHSLGCAMSQIVEGKKCDGSCFKNQQVNSDEKHIKLFGENITEAINTIRKILRR